MVRQPETKIASLAYVVLAAVLLVFHPPLEDVGLCEGCTAGARLLYPLFHAGILHYAINAWCLLSIAFTYDMPVWTFVASYIVAVTAPAGLLGITTPTVGVSGCLLFLLGSLSFRVVRKWYWQIWWLSFILVGFFFSGVAASLHAYCYAVGVVASFLTTKR